jgi:hypothetical protein
MARPRSKVERQRLTHSIKQHCLLLRQHLLLYALPSFVVVLINGDYLPLFVQLPKLRLQCGQLVCVYGIVLTCSTT